MEKKETTPRRAARRSYEERNKDKRKQTSGNFGTMIPRDLFDEINAFLKERNITKVDFIRTAYEIMKSENNGTHKRSCYRELLKLNYRIALSNEKERLANFFRESFFVFTNMVMVDLFGLIN